MKNSTIKIITYIIIILVTVLAIGFAVFITNGFTEKPKSFYVDINGNKEEVTQDYTLYEKIVSSLNLTENMRIALECRQNGLSYPEIGRVLSRTQSTVFEYFIKMRQRYTTIYG